MMLIFFPPDRALTLPASSIPPFGVGFAFDKHPPLFDARTGAEQFRCLLILVY